MLIALPNAFGDAATNMAIDAALLESIPSGLAAFRHYAWLEPSVTFGYAQHYQSVASALAEPKAKGVHDQLDTSPQPTYCRRLTGGGIVDHRNDWTYALIIQRSLPCAATPATELYQQIHRAISLALLEMDIQSQLAPCHKACNHTHPVSRNTSASQCFVSPATNDVLRPDGQKIAGAAMKRSRHGLLIQGSLDRGALPEAFDDLTFQKQLLSNLSTALDLPMSELEDIRPLFNSERIEREKLRFASEAWNKKR